jgi:carbon-monoxide dehydrogenase large subunit
VPDLARLEDHRLLTAGGRYVSDLAVEGALHLVFVRSARAHARIAAVDCGPARAVPGVVAVFTAADVDVAPLPPEPSMLNQAMPQPVLAGDVTRFVGEPLAVVVADSRRVAVAAAELVTVDYEPLPVVTDVSRAAADEVVLHPEAGTNTAFKLTFARPAGRADTFEGCEVVVRQEMDNQRLAPCPMEVRAAAARWETDGRLTFWGTTQGPHLWRTRLAAALGVPEEQVRVISPDVGGGFGAKGLCYPEDIVVAWAARRLDRPVRWTEDRSESMLGLGHGRAQRQVVELGGTRDGTIQAYRLTVVQDCGAYPRLGAFLPYGTRTMMTGVYDIRRAKFVSSSVCTNTTPTVAYRGAGQPEAAAALERIVDVYAAEIGLDPVEVRRRNLIRPEAMPYTTLTRSTYDGGDYPGALERVLAAADYPALRAEQARRREAGDTTLLGIGVATFVKITNAEMRPEYGSVEVTADGRCQVRVGTFSHGQGHATAYAEVAGARLGIGADRIDVDDSDSDAIPFGGGTGGSRSLQTGGVAVGRAAAALVEAALPVAAKVLGVDEAVFEAGTFRPAGTDPSAAVLDWAALVAAHGAPLRAESSYTASGPTFPSGAYLAVVEVDTGTGQVTLRRLVAVDDAGRIHHPTLAEGQVHGGLAQGVAQALFEHMRYDDEGRPVTGTLASYGCVSAPELPFFETATIETPSTVNELGARGIGESGAVGAPPAVQNAVVDALAHLGVRHIDMPTTPERVWRALRDA